MLGIFSSEINKLYVVCISNKTPKLTTLPQAENKRSKIPLDYAWVSTLGY
jgi:hypothetical protein